MSNWSINNNGNKLLAYFEPGCSKKQVKPLSIEAGLWHESENIYSKEEMDPITGLKHKIVSFGPDPNSSYFNKSCVGFPNSKILGLELLGAFKTPDDSVSRSNTSVEQYMGPSSFQIRNQIHFFLNPNFEGKTFFEFNNCFKIFRLINLLCRFRFSFPK